jgi:hypothetical protein
MRLDSYFYKGEVFVLDVSNESSGDFGRRRQLRDFGNYPKGSDVVWNEADARRLEGASPVRPSTATLYNMNCEESECD